MNHLIHRVSVDLRARSRVAAVVAQEATSRALQHDLPAALEAVFDARFPGNTTYRLDRLEVDLGALPERGFRKAFLAGVIKSLTDFDAKYRLDRFDLGGPPTGGFRNAIVTGVTKSFTDFDAKGMPPQPGVRIPKGPQFEQPGDQTAPSEGDAVQAFLFYIVHGSLPWFFPFERWRDEIPKALISGEAFSTLRSRLPSLVLEDPVRLQRLLPFPSLVTALFASEFRVAEESAALAEASLPAGPFDARIQLALWYLRLIPEPAAKVEDAKVEMALLGLLANYRGGAASIELRDFQPVISALAAFRRATQSPEIVRLSQLITRARRTVSNFRARGRIEFAKSESSGTTEDLAEIGVPTESAGIVLLHPFLIRFFQLFGWLDDRLRILDERRWHAVHALHWITHKHRARDDAELALEKALCQIPIQDPAHWPEVGSRVIEEAESLLRAVIGHWKALKDTSPDGLREAFLARPGLFYAVEPPRLHVETRGYDMLLSRLPWSFDRVALPWLRSAIHVRWPAPA